MHLDISNTLHQGLAADCIKACKEDKAQICLSDHAAQGCSVWALLLKQ